MEETVEFVEDLPLISKIAFGGIRGATQALINMASVPLTFYYQVKLGLEAYWISIAFLLFMVWNAINDPIFGVLEDRTKSEKYGRRIPYIRFGAPFLGILFVFVWIPVIQLDTQISLFFYLLFTLLAFDTIGTLMTLAEFALPAEMAFTTKGRTSLGITYNIFLAVGTGVSFVFPMLFLTGDESNTINPLLYPALIILAIITVIIIFFCSYFVKENEWTQTEETLGFIDGLRESFKNRPFIINQLVQFSLGIALSIFMTGIFYFVDYILRISGFLTVLPLLIVYGVFILSTLKIQSLNEKYGMKNAFLYFGLIFSGFSFILLFFLGWNIITAFIAMIPFGVGMGITNILSIPIHSDTIDYDETRTGKRRESTYSGISALFIKPTVSLATVIFLLTIGAFGFKDGVGASGQPESAFMGVMVAFTLIPAIFMFIAAFIMRYYPLDGPEWDEEKRKIQKIHEEKEREYIKYLKEKHIL